VSAYLPVNAAFHAAGALVGAADLVAPLLVAIGAVALWRIAVRLWPEERQVQLVVLLLYAGSSQVLIAGMTRYAMSAHLALNLVWLRCICAAGGRHGGALAVGFLASGLHQLLFHPLFAVPFVLLLGQRRRWRAFAGYAVGYARSGCSGWGGRLGSVRSGDGQRGHGQAGAGACAAAGAGCERGPG
jgi:hypothetical protein